FEQLAGQAGPGVGMDSDGREAVTSHHDWVFPDDVAPGSDLAYRDHVSDSRTPDLQAVDHANIVSLVQRRTGNDRQEPGFLRVDSRGGAARLPVKANDAPFKAGLQGLCHLNAGDAVAVCLQFEYVGTNHFFTLEPVVPHAY